MTNSTLTSRHWIGHWLMLVAALHTAFGLVVFHADLLAMAQLGFFKHRGTRPSARGRGIFYVVWFFAGRAGASNHGVGTQWSTRCTAPRRLVPVAVVCRVRFIDAGLWLLAGGASLVGATAQTRAMKTALPRTIAPSENNR